MGRRDARARENQELFRTANERIGEVARGAASREVSIPFLCECASDACLARIELTLSEYEKVRTRQNQFVIIPGHETIEGERAIEDNGRFQIVRKDQS
jgi:hypothetical protein